MTKMPALSDRAIGNILKRWCGPAVSLVPFSRAIAKAQRELLKGWIPLPSDERMADITAKAGGLP
ncbi:MAG: hypothetical protein IMF11_06795, partial [Proteobacteria bacterium]|nr:hypothetical protein [Pseudomonadota bacterium]